MTRPQLLLLDNTNHPAMSRLFWPRRHQQWHQPTRSLPSAT